MSPGHPLIQKVFLLDDDPDDCDLFEEALKAIDPGISFTCTHRSEFVYEHIINNPPDLIFLDINIPCISGFDCLREIQDHATTRKIPVVMYSNSGSRKDVNASYGLGATLYFQKPVRLSSLIASLQSLLVLPWHDPLEISNRYFKAGKYQMYPLSP